MDDLEEFGGDGPPDWPERAKGLLKAELKLRNMTYAHLVHSLARIGITETEANLRNKISRGNFSAAFFLQVLDSIGCTLLHLDSSRMVVRRYRPKFSEETRALFRKRAAEFDVDKDDEV